MGRLCEFGIVTALLYDELNIRYDTATFTVDITPYWPLFYVLTTD